MKRIITLTFMLAAFAAALLFTQSITTAQPQDRAAEAALRTAMDKETLEGDLKGAIEQYKKVAQSKDRSIAARALIRMAESYEKLGDSEARRIYERIASQYGDQKEAVRIARERLGRSEPTPSLVARTVLTCPPAPGCGRVSSDGRFTSYSRISDVFVHEIATGAVRNLTNQPKGGRDQAYESEISPDGKRVAYIWRKEADNRYQVRLANLIGDPNPRTLYDSPDVYDIWFGDWSPDGKWIAVELRRFDKTNQIALVSTADGSLSALKTIEWPADRATVGLDFSPDGKYLGYDLRQSNEERHIFALAVDGSREISLLKQTGDNRMMGWSPDGKWIVFWTDRSGREDLWGIAFNDGKPGTPQLLKTDVGRTFGPAGWTREGALYYTKTSNAFRGKTRLHLGSLDFSRSVFSSSPVEATRGPQEDTDSPRWSPDGVSLAYRSTLRDGSGGSELTVRNAVTGATRTIRPKQITNLSLLGWTPDGRSTLVAANDQQARRGFYRVDMESGEATAAVMFPVDGSFGPILWMPDGVSLVAFGLGKTGIYRLNTETGDASAVILDPTIGPDFALSPDGKTLYYHRRPTPSDDVLIERDIDTGREREIIRRPFLSSLSVNLSPDGKYIAAPTVDIPSNNRVILLIPTDWREPVRELMRVPYGLKPESMSQSALNFELNNRTLEFVSWAGDSQSLVLKKFSRDANKSDELFSVHLDGKESGKVNIPTAPLVFANPGPTITISPGQRHVAYTISEPPAPLITEVSILENFLPRATKK